MSTVYVIHAAAEPRDISDAIRFGEPANVFDPGDWPTMMPAAATIKVAERLAEFSSDQDYLLWYGGDPMALVAVGAWIERYEVQPRWLRASRTLRRDEATGEKIRSRSFTYQPVTIDFRWSDE